VVPNDDDDDSHPGPCMTVDSDIVNLKKKQGKKLQFLDRQPSIFDRINYGCSKIYLVLKFSKMAIILVLNSKLKEFG